MKEERRLMSKHRWCRAMIILMALVAVFAPVRAEAAVQQEPSVVAWFEGNWIRLADGWGDAHACTSDGVTARCYRNEAAMDAAERPFPGSTDVVSLACSGAVRLYRLTGYSGDVLQLTTQYVYINLATHGFDNDTSSYQIGPCNSYFYDTTTGSGPYPGTTTAGYSASSMVSGWDNRVGSVYIS